ncbi:hypothetical protein [Burkholderia gladioli]|uniref:hypothetical protein n=1 Tax=Burkholderia gladioli TaxID=28095 RepID=UPI002363A14C|nr:hypothetical protein [Burkholderia gladioli]MDD1790153.1 hypothetical protein [Burkholderia gladioli]
MLRLTVELWPGGREPGKKVLATASIARVKNGALADYEVELHDEALGAVGDIAHVCAYPRWSASVWDLVARSIAVALTEGKEQLPVRPVSPEVPIHVNEHGQRYVRDSEIPEPTRTLFALYSAGSACPALDCAYAHDWHDFLAGSR